MWERRKEWLNVLRNLARYYWWDLYVRQELEEGVDFIYLCDVRYKWVDYGSVGSCVSSGEFCWDRGMWDCSV